MGFSLLGVISRAWEVHAVEKYRLRSGKVASRLKGYQKHFKFRYKIVDPRFFCPVLRGEKSGEFDHYEPVPQNIAQLIIEGKKR